MELKTYTVIQYSVLTVQTANFAWRAEYIARAHFHSVWSICHVLASLPIRHVLATCQISQQHQALNTVLPFHARILRLQTRILAIGKLGMITNLSRKLPTMPCCVLD